MGDGLCSAFYKGSDCNLLIRCWSIKTCAMLRGAVTVQNIGQNSRSGPSHHSCTVLDQGLINVCVTHRHPENLSVACPAGLVTGLRRGRSAVYTWPGVVGGCNVRSVRWVGVGAAHCQIPWCVKRTETYFELKQSVNGLCEIPKKITKAKPNRLLVAWTCQPPTV